ncbi:DUF465 domain-containing protein [Rhodobacteraceae bacterium NNCM2]|nr:DUF465 domain-containing protein [Coraliihabitans acroporae]
MTHTPHELADTFPEHADKIHTLKVENAHFRKLSDEYHALNRDIHRGETNVEPMSDTHLEDLKKRRLQLLDELRKMLD